MNKEEAIKELQESLDTLREYDIAHSSRLKQALEMAIQALSQEPTKEEWAILQKWRDNRGISIKDFGDAMNALQEPCTDAVSRDAVLNAVSEGCQELRGVYGRCEELINALPPVTVQQCSLYSISEDGRGLCALLEENPDDTLLAKERQIDKLPSVTQKSGWVSCSERLPKAGEYIGNVAKHYLVQNEYGDMLVARYTHGEYWEQIYQLKPIGDEIVAWMPLPKPYEPQERSDKG